MKPYVEPLMLVLAIVFGSLIGLFLPFENGLTDYFIIALLFFIFYNISFVSFVKKIGHKKYLSVAWITNFILLPTLAFIIASIFTDNASPVFIGLIFYLVAPCTDWFLGFTKLAKGDVELNSALLPINLLSQILLLPVYLYLFTSNGVSVPFSAFLDTLIYWVIIPFVAAQIIRFIIVKLGSTIEQKADTVVEFATLASLTLVVFSLFQSNILSLKENVYLLPVILAVIFIFFVVVYFLTKWIAKLVGFTKKEEISLAMTTAARNAPLMLAISLGVFPEATIVHLVLIIGMLVELPHLIAITYILKR